MPNHDFKCDACGAVLKDQYRSISEGGSARPPSCLRCGTRMTWVTPVPRMDLRSDGTSATFQKFYARDGRNNLVEIDSTHKLREVERESEQLARNGEGQIVRFRAWEQNHSNMGVNVFGERPANEPDMQLTPEGKKKFGLQRGAQHIDASEGEPDCPYGPGVTDANTSPLEDL